MQLSINSFFKDDFYITNLVRVGGDNSFPWTLFSRYNIKL